MTNSKKVGPFTLRPLVRNGRETGQWQIDVPPRFALSGKRERLSFGSLDAAREAATRFTLEIRMRGSVSRRDDGRLGDTEAAFTLNAVAQQWMEHQRLRVDTGKKKQSSLLTNCYQLVPVLNAMGSVTLDRLSSQHLEEYQAARRRAGIKARSINSELATLTQIQRWAKAKGLLREVVFTDPIPYVQAEVPILTDEEARRLLSALPERVRPFVWFLAETGCRFGEAAQLLLKDIDLDHGIAHVRRREDWSPKTPGSARRLLLSPALCDVIREQERSPECSFVFEGRVPGKPIDDIRRSLRAAVKAADIRRGGELVHFRPKDLRSNFATWVAMSGTRERQLQEMMGHVPGSRVTKKHYERATVAEHLEAAARIHALLRPTGGEHQRTE